MRFPADRPEGNNEIHKNSVFCTFPSTKTHCVSDGLNCNTEVTVQAHLILGCFLQALAQQKALVSAAFFTERERPTEAVMHKRRIVFSRA